MKLRIVGLLMAAIAILGACGGDDTSSSGNASAASDSQGDAAGLTTATVTAKDLAFSPSSLSVKPGAEITVTFVNDDSVPHTFTSEDLGVDTQVEPGDSAEVTFTAPESGTVEWRCTIHGSMSGTISVGETAKSDNGGDDDSGDSAYDY